jgi:DNA mismatch repair protein MutS
MATSITASPSLSNSTLNTPMLRQYMAIKKDYPDSILFFRLGDFYEMFLDDAITASNELGLTLTGRGKEENRIPMCGIPYHAVDNYLPKLVDKGYKVAICEQVEDPATAEGITKREVVKVVTPGTVLTPQTLEATDNNYLAAICDIKQSDQVGVSFADISTGEFKLCQIESTQLPNILSILDIKELLIDDQLNIPELNTMPISKSLQEMVSTNRANTELCAHFKVSNLSGFGIQSVDSAYPAAWAILDYVLKTQKNSAPQLTKCVLLKLADTMKIDTVSAQNLELIRHAHTRQKKGSLFWVLNHTKTAMGGRKLQSLIKYPSLNLTEINHRLDAVSVLKDDLLSREEIRDCLKQVYDIERLIARIVTGLNNPKDIIAIKNSLYHSQQLAQILPHLDASEKLKSINKFITQMSQDSHPFHQIITTINQAIVDTPPNTTREGNLIKHGYHTELDALTHSFSDIKQWINQLEGVERSRTGIKSLKVGFNKVFGYYFQISNTVKDKIPDNYIRKQTLSNAERYITPELKEKETILLNGEEKQITLEQSIYQDIVQIVAQHIPHLQELAALLAELDCIQSLATHAQKYQYCRPIFCPKEEKKIMITHNRHPVLEKTEGATLVSNDITLTKDTPFTLITGPNMAGKSTIMRQVALTVIMAQIGSFVPAKSAQLSPVDQLFTRIGALDNLYSGQSTFMVEMLETAAILHNATSESLILLDEVGRGTSTYDGLSIASAVSEFIYTTIEARTFFATHYHELTQLNHQYKGIVNFSMKIQETEGKLLFTYQFQSGPADKSYGIHVASMAGIPQQVIQRAEYFLSHFETQQQNPDMASGQLSLF